MPKLNMTIQNIAAKSIEKIAEHSTQISAYSIGGVAIGQWLSTVAMLVSIFVGVSTMIITYIYKSRQDRRDQKRFERGD